MKRAFFIAVITMLCLSFEAYGETVVGIHGLINSSKSMKQVKRTLKGSGYQVYLWDYPSRKRCIEEHACHLVSHLQQIACNCPGEPIHFVAHSIGALVLRAAINRPDCPQEAKSGRVVLIAPPNQGSCLARGFRNNTAVMFVLGKKCGAQLMCYDPCEIASYFGEFPSSMDVLVIAGTKGNTIWFNGPNDGYLGLEETRLNTPFYFRSYPVTHGELLSYKPSLCCMRSFICGNCLEVQEVDMILNECCEADEEEVYESGTCQIDNIENELEFEATCQQIGENPPESIHEISGELSEATIDYSIEVDACHSEAEEHFRSS